MYRTIVIAVVDGESTVKRLFKRAGKIRPQAENPDYALHRVAGWTRTAGLGVEQRHPYPAHMSQFALVDGQQLLPQVVSGFQSQAGRQACGGPSNNDGFNQPFSHIVV